MEKLDHSERIVVLETKLEQMERTQEETNIKLDQILHEMTRYKGFLGGIMFLLSGIGVIWSLVHGWVGKHFQ